MRLHGSKWGVFLLALTCVTSASAGARVDLQGQGYALLIGVGQYEDGSIASLPYADNDVQELGKTLIASGYLPGNVIVMHSKAERPHLRPTGRNIREQLKSISLLSAESVLIAVSGHSAVFSDVEGLGFVPTDGARVGTGLVREAELHEALSKSDAKLRLLLWDAARQKTKATACPRGNHVLYGCQEGQLSHEDAKIQHSVFSFFVIQALSGAADFDHDGAITLPELELFTSQNVLAYGRIRGLHQAPDRFGHGSSLQPIVRLPWARAKDVPPK